MLGSDRNPDDRNVMFKTAPDHSVHKCQRIVKSHYHGLYQHFFTCHLKSKVSRVSDYCIVRMNMGDGALGYFQFHFNFEIVYVFCTVPSVQACTAYKMHYHIGEMTMDR